MITLPGLFALGFNQAVLTNQQQYESNAHTSKKFTEVDIFTLKFI